MLSPLNIEPEEYTPKVVLNQAEGYFEISGSSLPENAVEFYEPIINWIREYSKNPNKKTELVLNFDYLNSSSSKKVAELLFALEDLSENGAEVKVIWYYLEEDDIMMSKGMLYKDTVVVPLELMVIDG